MILVLLVLWLMIASAIARYMSSGDTVRTPAQALEGAFLVGAIVALVIATVSALR